MKKTVIGFILWMMVFVIGCCFGSAAADKSPVQIGEMASDFSVMLLDDSEFRLSDYLGKVVFVNVWASWCGPCVSEIPDLQQIAEEYPDTLVILGVNSGEDEQTVRDFINDNQLTYFHATDENYDLIDSVFPTQYIPYTTVIDPTGTVLYAESGSQSYNTFKAWYEEAVTNIVPEVSPAPSAVETPAPVAVELLSYNDAIARLGGISLTDQDALNQIYQSFQAVGSRYFAPQYMYLTQALLQLSGNENVDFDRIEISLTILKSNGAFIQSYTSDPSLAYLPLDSLLVYVNTRRLEADGKLEEAYQAYISNQILDSVDRAIAIGMQLAPPAVPDEPATGFPFLPGQNGSEIQWSADEQEIVDYLTAFGTSPRVESYGQLTALVSYSYLPDTEGETTFYTSFGLLNDQLVIVACSANEQITVADLIGRLKGSSNSTPFTDPTLICNYMDYLADEQYTAEDFEEFSGWYSPDGTLTCIFATEYDSVVILCINVPVLETYGIPNGLGNNTNGRYAAIDDGVLYYENGNDVYNIYSADPNGENQQKLFQVSGYPNEGMCVADGYVYHVDHNRLIKTSIDGKTSEVILEDMLSLRYAPDFLVHQNRIYIRCNPFDDQNNLRDNIFSIRTDGSGLVTFQNAKVGEMTAYGEYMFYTSHSGSDIYRTDLYGQNKVLLMSGPAQSLNVSKEWIYFSDDNSIMKMKHDGSDLQEILQGGVSYFNISGSRIFYLAGDMDARSIRTANLDGTDDYEVCDDIITWYLTIAGDWIYFYQHEPHESGGYLNIGLYKIKKDGSDMQRVEPYIYR